MYKKQKYFIESSGGHLSFYLLFDFGERFTRISWLIVQTCRQENFDVFSLPPFASPEHNVMTILPNTHVLNAHTSQNKNQYFIYR